jgi:uncharacterized protein (TIGR03437 family)
MKTHYAKAAALAVAAFCFEISGYAQSTGPTASPGSLNFSYQVNATLPSPVKVTVSLPAASSALPLSVTGVTSSPQGWLTVTPDNGHAPLALTVTVNPTGLAPGSYAGTITIDTTPGSKLPATVSVTLLITNPPSTMVLSPSSSTTNYSPPPSGSSTPTLTFLYTTGTVAASPTSSELDVSSTGDIIPFNVTVGSGKGTSTTSWIRVASSLTQLPSLATSGSAFPGSSSPVYVTLDMSTVATLDPGSYAGQITIAAVNSANGSWTVAVSLIVTAGPPVLKTMPGATSPIYPWQMSASPVIDAVITINGDNFFSTSVVTMQLGGNQAITLPSTLLSRKVLQATIKKDYLAPPITPAVYPATWTIAVTNPAPPNNPAQAPATTTLVITDPSLPSITGVVNAASYLTTSVWTGTAGGNPVTAPNPLRSVSPREIISIFGQNLGPSTVSTANPTATPPSTTLVYPTSWNSVQVAFTWVDPVTSNPQSTLAPIIMTSLNQINVVVPKELGALAGTANPVATIQVTNGAAPAAGTTVTVVAEDPGIFTFAGLGQGPGAILNYDSSGVPTINSTKNAAARGSAIAIFVTGMGELVDATWENGAVLPSTGGAVKLADATYRVDIDGQPAVVTYAGSSPGAVAGLVQVNAIVPPTARTGQAIVITVSIGATAVSRRSQPGVTFAVN